jgi:non-ribosomal peptide synthetase component E (peptide arylation enzyme)
MTDGTVPWPDELALQYARAGWWRGRDLGTEFAAIEREGVTITAVVPAVAQRWLARATRSASSTPTAATFPTASRARC